MFQKIFHFFEMFHFLETNVSFFPRNVPFFFNFLHFFVEMCQKCGKNGVFWPISSIFRPKCGKNGHSNRRLVGILAKMAGLLAQIAAHVGIMATCVGQSGPLGHISQPIAAQVGP